MKKDDAKALISNIHDEILSQVNRSEDEVDEALFIDYLHDIAHALLKSDFKRPFNFFSPALTFEEEYKLLAQQSLDSYTDTSEKVAEISREQLDALDALQGTTINVDDLAQRFSSIQSHLSGEVDRANSTINSLVNRVKELESKAAIDPLTKTYNRRTLDTYLQTILEHTEDRAIQMHLFMIDVDDFKSINDTYGHLVGDKVLIFLSNLLKKTLRDGDKVFRYGGEEFIIILNRITNDGCRLVAERLLELTRNNKLISQKQQISVTISIGATPYRAGDTMESIIQRADEALYLAKKSGKNQLKVKA